MDSGERKNVNRAIAQKIHIDNVINWDAIMQLTFLLTYEQVRGGAGNETTL